ncbi:MAG: hypothetical protein CME64_01790 [Halobacteriovoraceae bacterium]|nr:hypothetical protein [Halobacteriovoraceae bacterium]
MRLLLLAFILSGLNVYAQDSEFGTSVTRHGSCEQEKLLAYNPIKGTVPLAYGHMPATDLICDSNDCGEGIRKGDVLTSSEADAYYKRRHSETRCQWTLADLEPAIDHESAHIYSGGPVEDYRNIDLSDHDQLDLNDLDKVDYVSEGWARLGNYRVTVTKDNRYGTPKQYSLFLSKSVHNFFLRKALLRKIGYKVPPVKYVPRLKIMFPNKEDKKLFIKNISINNAGSFDRWILSQGDLSVVVQDVAVMEDQEFLHNLAKGYLSEDIPQGKRIYDSLVVPFALVDAPESINLMDWTIGRRFSDNVSLKFAHAANYNCSRDDAVWIIRRIMKLNEQDWRDIVDATYLPESVKLLLLQKLKSRRNHLGFLFGVDNVNLSVNSTISNQDDLVDGEITKEFYDGYARRFKIPDPESPLSTSEMTAFFKSKEISVGIDVLVKTANSFLRNNIKDKIVDFKEDLANEVAKTATTGDTGKLPVDFFMYPTVRGNLIVGREVVAGSYMGTDNLIQLVDTVGGSISAGVFGGATGIYTKTGDTVMSAAGEVRQYVPVDLNVRANLYLSRTYAHVRPITSVEKALKYPFKNMMVPYLKNKYGNALDPIAKEFYQNLSDDMRIRRNGKLYKKANELLDEITNLHASNLLASDVEVELQKIVSLHSDLKENYINIVREDGLSEIYPIGKSLVDYHTKLKGSLDYIVDTECGQDCEEQAQREEFIDENYSDTIALLTKVDELNDLHNLHYSELKEQDDELAIEKALQAIDENIAVGESMIITDSFGGSGGIGVGMNLYEVSNIGVNIAASKNVLSRLHIFRASEEEVHVYKDLGNVTAIEPSVSVEKYIPIMKFRFKSTSGRARTKFHKVPIKSAYKGEINVKQLDYLKALRSAFLSNSTQSLEKVENPYVLIHDFEEDDSRFGIFVWKWNWLDQYDNISITSPDGHTKDLYRSVIGNNFGRDYENYAKDLIELLAGKLMDKTFNVASFSGGNPGYTYMGKAENEILTYEGIKGESGFVENPYAKLSRIYNGWKMSKDDAIELLRKIKKRYAFRFMEEEVLAQTEELFLYNINVNFFIYENGIKHFIEMSEEEAEDIFVYNRRRQRNRRLNWEDSLKRSGYYRFAHNKRKYFQALEEGDQNEMAEYTMEMVEAIEEGLVMEGIGKMVGGGGNMLAIARIDGFRVGDPNGDKKIISNSFGRKGTEDIEGPIARIRKFLGMTKGEFFASWLLGRLI